MGRRPSLTRQLHEQKPRTVRVSKRDNYFQRAEVLKRNREKRTHHQQFLVEGVSQISIAVKHGWHVSAFLFAAGQKLSKWAEDLLQSGGAQELWELNPELMAELSDKDETSELLAILECRRFPMNEIRPVKDGLIVVFDRPSSPGNLGSSIRSADSFGAHAVIVTGHAVDIYDPFVVRGSMGALFTLPVVTATSHADVLEWATAARSAGYDYQIVGSSSKAQTVAWEHGFSRPTILVLGNETVGMSRGYCDICDSTVKIPISGALSSINVSCAASILLYEIARQRQAKQV